MSIEPQEWLVRCDQCQYVSGPSLSLYVGLTPDEVLSIIEAAGWDVKIVSGVEALHVNELTYCPNCVKEKKDYARYKKMKEDYD
jgi:rubredoxin